MRTSQRAVQWIGVLTLVASSTVPMVASAASLGAGGTIYFSGAVVEPSFGIATSVSDKSQGFRTDNTASGSISAVDVKFTPSPNSAPAAQVALLVNDGGAVSAPRTLSTQFVDRDGRRSAPVGDAHYHVGGAGGTLSVAAGAKGGAAERAVTVVVSYD